MPTTSTVSSVSPRDLPAPAVPTPALLQDVTLTLAALWHDLRTPLTVIKGSAQWLTRRFEMASADSAALVEGLAHIEGAATRMESILDDLGDLARAGNGQAPELDLRPTDLVALAHHVADEQQLLAGGRVIKVTSETSELVGTWDKVRLARVLANLYSNALKYSFPGTPVAVSVVREGSGRARLEVVDEGIGIPSEDLPRIFAPFYRGANAADQAAGTGIGLASVRAIVERHGGTVKLNSAVGRGTRVTIRLPLAPPLPRMEQCYDD
jgi:signal transduction histidine kinase